MADVFFSTDARKLLHNKYIIMLGDSNTRAIYKDLITLLTRNALIEQAALKRKQEPSYCGDVLGNHSELFRGRDYREERSFNKFNVRVEFYFLNKCHNPTIDELMEDIHLGLHDAPDVIYMNSTLWDMSRWGPNGPTDFKDNMNKLARQMKSSLPESTLVIWGTALPLSPNINSSLLHKQISVAQNILRFDVMEANSFARQVMAANGFDILDFHFHMRMQIHRRIMDGVHYLPSAVRFLTNLILTHLALSWDIQLPNRIETILLDKAKTEDAEKVVTSPTQQLQNLQKIVEKPVKVEKKNKEIRKEKKETRPNLKKELFHRQPRKPKGKKRRGAYNGAFNQGNDHYRPKEKIISPWESGEEPRNDFPPPTAYSGISFSDEPWQDHSIQEESHYRNKPRYDDNPRVYDEQFQNGRYGDSRFQNDTFEPQFPRESFSRYRPDPFEGRFQDQRYPSEFDNGIPPFVGSQPRFMNGFHGNEFEPEPPNRRQLLSTMVRSDRYAPY